jgi:hypothetical protein
MVISISVNRYSPIVGVDEVDTTVFNLITIYIMVLKEQDHVIANLNNNISGSDFGKGKY